MGQPRGRQIRAGWRAVLGRHAMCLLCLPLLVACSAGTPATPLATPTGDRRPTTATAIVPPTPPTTTTTATGAARTATTSRPAAETATRAATTTRAAASATPGAVPAGWRSYRSGLPFTIAVPPDWIIEDQAAQGLIYFYAPIAERTIFLVIATTGRGEPNPNLDVLRDQWYRARTANCQRFAIEQTGQARYAAIDFATLGATCDLPTGLAFSLTGIGLRQQTPWIFEFNAPYGSFAPIREAVFEPMIRSWTFDGTQTR